MDRLGGEPPRTQPLPAAPPLRYLQPPPLFEADFPGDITGHVTEWPAPGGEAKAPRGWKEPPGRDSPPTAAAARHSRGPGTKPLDAALRSRPAPEMSPRWGAGFLALLFLLAQLPPPGDGNEGSAIGSCYCHKAIPSGPPPMAEFMAHLRKHLRAYDRCNSYVSTQVPEPTRRAPSDMGSPAQTHLPPTSRSTAQPTLPAGERALDKKLTHANEIATSTEGQGLGAGPEAGERQKQLEEKPGPSAGTLALVPVLSLLTIVFILTTVLLYVLCKRMKHSVQQSPDLQLHYTPVASDYNA
ncbi:PREDICTED: c-X-C motif chemokine 16 [Odobenus rosmarus divergens]|uniref:C-X-C motif chemokine 16 n=1 Tax=Odobenus rosmarus divergens TaxID=9708 RepID=A0A9B0LLX0_ODORO